MEKKTKGIINISKNTKLHILILIAALLVMFIPNIPNASAIFDSKYQDYSATFMGYPTIVHKDFLGQEVQEFKLVDHTPECLIDCHSEQNITLYFDGALIDDIRFVDPDNQIINVPYSVKYEISEDYAVDVPTFKNVCFDDIKNESGIFKNCSDVLDHLDKEIRTRTYWKDYKLGESLKRGTYTILIEVKKPINKNIDWQIKSNGIWNTEQAWYSSSWLKRKLINITDPLTPDMNRTEMFLATFTDLKTTSNCTTELRVTDYAGTVEIPSYSKIINSSNCEVSFIFSKIDTETEKDYYLYYDNPGATYPNYATNLTYTPATNQRITNYAYNLTLGNGTIGTGTTGIIINYNHSGWNANNQHTNSWYFSNTSAGLGFASQIAESNPIYIKLSYTEKSLKAFNLTIYNGLDFWRLENFTGFADGTSGLGAGMATGGGVDKCITYRTADQAYSSTCGDVNAGTAVIAGYLDYYRNGDTNTFFLIYANNSASNSNATYNMGYYLRDADPNDLQATFLGSDYTTPKGRIGQTRSLYFGFSPSDNVQRERLFMTLTNPFNYSIGPAEDFAGVQAIQNYPADGYNTSNNTVNIGCNFTAFGTPFIQNYTLKVFDSSNNLDYTSYQTSGITRSINATYTTTALGDDKYNWSCEVRGDGSEFSYDGNRSFIINTTPYINFVTPTPVSYYNSSFNTLYVNVTYNNTYFSNMTFYLYNSTGLYTKNFTTDSSQTFYNFTVNRDGFYNYSVWINTTTGQQNVTSTRYWNLSTIPYINFFTPTPVDYFNSSFNTLYINVTNNNTYLSNMTFYLYNSTGLYASNFTTDASQTFYNFTINRDGFYNYSVWINTTTGQQNVTSTRYWNLSTIPFIDFVSPTPVNTYNATYRSLYINVTYNKTYFSNITFNLYNESGLYDSNFTTDSNQNFYNFTSIARDGNYTFNVTIKTNTGQENTTVNRNFSIDTVYPLINISKPSGTYWMPYNAAWIDLNYSASDIHLKNCSYSFNGAAKVAYSCAVNFTGLNVTILGINNLTLYANDTFGNENSSTRYFYVYPTISLCNDTYSQKILNVSFLDESTLQPMNASLALASFNYWYDGSNNNNSFIYTNLTDNYNYLFCVYPNFTSNITAIPRIQYSSSTYSATATYPTRVYQTDSVTYLNVTPVNLTLYLLSTTSGNYVTFITQASGGAILADSTIRVYRQFGGVWTLIAQDTTDDAGSATFFLNPSFVHQITASHDGYQSVTIDITPTQPTYTIVLGASGIFAINYQGLLEGMLWGMYPPSGLLSAGTHNISFAVNFQSTKGIPLQNCSLALLDRSKNIVNITYNLTNSTYCFVQYSNYYFNESRFGMFSVKVNGTWIPLESDANWIVYAPTTSGTTLSDFFSQATTLPQWGDNPNTNDFSRICFFFLMVAIILAGINFYTNYDMLYPGSSIYILWVLITFATFCNGFAGPGYFYMNNTVNIMGFNNTVQGGTTLAVSDVLNNIIIWVMVSMIMGSATVMNMKKNEGQ